MPSLLDTLNPGQRQAVTALDGSALIIAGAGSGKTRVLTTRIAWLLENGHARAANILAVTFTNKAAREMLTRIHTLMPLAQGQLWVGTFHSLCHRLLRLHALQAGLPAGFQILDSNDQTSVIKRLLKRLNLVEEQYPARQVSFYINSAKEQGLRANQVQAQDAFHRALATIYAEYESLCQREGLVDFAELLLRADELLRNVPALRAHYQARFRHILVDEFQDTNEMQYGWIQHLAFYGEQPPAQVFAVGDDDQSIYAFRGAKVSHMFAFENDFKVQHVIRLEHNYRSSGHILDSANALIAHNAQRLGKTLFTDEGAGELVRVMACMTDYDEAQWLVEEISALQDSGKALDQVAVLYRSNAQSRLLEHSFFQAGLPYRVYGGLRFFDRAEIKKTLAFLQLLENTNNDTAFLAVVNFPPRGIGARSIEQLQDAATRAQCPLVAAVEFVSGKAQQHLQQFVHLIEELQAVQVRASLPQLIEAVCEQSGMRAHYQAERDGADRVENLYELINAATQFESERTSNPVPTDNEAPVSEDSTVRGSLLAEFLAHAALESGERQAEQGVAALQLMTVHAAKGLEFDAVFITGVEEGLFPHDNSLTAQDGIEEERRLMYVALTRARQRLFISYAKSRMLHGRPRFGVASRFIDELPSENTKRLGEVATKTPAYPSGNSSDHWFSVPSTAKDADSPWQVGQRVQHPRFGRGSVEAVYASKQEIRIAFDEQGIKTLDLTVTQLTVAT